MERFDIDDNSGTEIENTPVGVRLFYHQQGMFHYFVSDSHRNRQPLGYNLNPSNPLAGIDAQNLSRVQSARNHRRLNILGQGGSEQVQGVEQGFLVGNIGLGINGAIDIDGLNSCIQELIAQNSPIHSIRLVGNYSLPRGERFVQRLADLTRVRVYASRGNITLNVRTLPPVNHETLGSRYLFRHEGILTDDRFFFRDPT
ncbi:hypothetical protein Xbed_03387 [Xenorhabdus beddingii]|uniref:Uncharacterized protein n=1 Tax=Xenorhabdus beddingii TaxID=40578 RepID=A0A1Y2SHD4_9GAMM|nr:hypothetical protein [Xenorhabdus beddingii]OTA16993.1 hypothetical protein Xbed_03387 [Xenorhabdus beddingii]